MTKGIDNLDYWQLAFVECAGKYIFEGVDLLIEIDKDLNLLTRN